MIRQGTLYRYQFSDGTKVYWTKWEEPQRIPLLKREKMFVPVRSKQDQLELMETLKKILSLPVRESIGGLGAESRAVKLMDWIEGIECQCDTNLWADAIFSEDIDVEDYLQFVDEAITRLERELALGQWTNKESEWFYSLLGGLVSCPPAVFVTRVDSRVLQLEVSVAVVDQALFTDAVLDSLIALVAIATGCPEPIIYLYTMPNARAKAAIAKAKKLT